jgi:hypothetical protein
MKRMKTDNVDDDNCSCGDNATTDNDENKSQNKKF